MNLAWIPMILGIVGLFSNAYLIFDCNRYNRNPNHFSKMDATASLAIGFPFSLIAIAAGLIGLAG